MLTTAQQSAILDIRVRTNALLQTLEDAASREMARVIAAELDALERLIAEGVIRNADQALAAYEIAIDSISARGADVMSALASDVLDLSLGANVEAVSQFNVISARILAVASQTTRADFMAYLLTEGHANWYMQLSEELRPAVREAVLDMTVRPRTMTQAAKSLADATDMSIARARGIVRTESTRADAAASVSFGEAAGIKRYVNVGVGDERQSDICRFASRQDAKTIDEWLRLRFEGEVVGPPPRHVRHCRCGFIPVPEPFAPSDALLEEAGVIG